MRNVVLLIVASLLLGVQSANDPLQVFIQRDVEIDGGDELLFINILSGEESRVLVNGERYTLVGRAVMFLDAVENRVRLATPDGRVRNHPFIQPHDDTRRLDWLVAEGQIAWTLTALLPDGQLQTITRVANLDGSNPREVLIDGPRPGIRALPVAFTPDRAGLYMDYQPDGIADFTPFQQYAGLFRVNFDEGEAVMLPGEPGCFCAAGLGADTLLRLDLAPDLSGFDVLVTNLGAATSDHIPALRLTNYTQAGNFIIAPDGSLAVYALAQIRDFGGPGQSVQTVFVLINLVDKTQSTLTDPITTFVQPVEWTEDNTAIIFTSADPNLDGTWKITLKDGRLTRVADATYIGTLGG